MAAHRIAVTVHLILAACAMSDCHAQSVDSLLAKAKTAIAAGRHEDAVAELTRAIELDPKAADAYDLRGSEQFKLGHIDESIADFDKFLALRPDQTAGHWRRGISYYYAGRFKEGQKQFEGYQSVDASDVENVVWRFLCMARAGGIEKARRELLKIGDDRRVPMRQIYELFAGRMKPEDVLAAAKAGDPKPEPLNERLMYAHLYVGLYHEAAGNKTKAKEHITTAAQKHKIGHYMWDVARVHAERLAKASAKANGAGGKRIPGGTP